MSFWNSVISEKESCTLCLFNSLGSPDREIDWFWQISHEFSAQFLTSDERKKISIRIFQGQRRALHPLYEIHDWRDFPPILAIVNNLKKIQLNLEILDFSSLIKLYFEEIESKLKKDIFIVVIVIVSPDLWEEIRLKPHKSWFL